MTDIVQVLKRPVLLRTVEGEQLLALASAVAVGEVLTYVAVKTAINVDMQSPAGRQLWHKAQGVLAAEKQMQFACVPRVGYKRLDDDGKVDKSGKYIGQAVGRVRAAGRVITTTDRANLSATKKAALDIQATVCSIMQNAAKPAIAATRAAAPDKAELDRIIAGVRELG